MSYQLALTSSVLTHGAKIIAGSPTMTVDGAPVARLGDPVMCPLANHGLNRITQVNVTAQCDGRTVAHTGARAACGAVIISGSATFSVG